jgi:hypothetical protein
MYSLFKSFIFLQMIIISCASVAQDNKEIHSVTHWHIPSNYYICMCTPTHVAKENVALNASNWDNICSNLQVCSWNKHEVIVRAWYHNEII